jgi:biotin carboxylase
VQYPSPAEDPEEFLAAVEAICSAEEIGAVLPLDEGVLELLARRLPRPGGAILVGPNIEQYRRLCDKGVLPIAASEAGLDHPTSVVAGVNERPDSWPALPSIVKLRFPGSSGVGRGARLVRTESEREMAVSELGKVDGTVVVQEQIVGKGWRVHFVRSQNAFTALAAITEGRYPRGTGFVTRTTYAAVPGPLLDAAESLCALVDYRGPGGIQFLEREGRYYVHDVNLRLPVSVAGTINAGLDMPRLAVEAALGRETAHDVLVRQFTYVWLDGEIRALVDRLRGQDDNSGPRSHAILMGLVRGLVSRQTLLDPTPSDPLPFLSYLAGLARRSVAPRRQ